MIVILRKLGRGGSTLICLAALGLAPPAMALDTTELFDRATADAELYLGHGGVGGSRVERELSNEIVLGYGLTERRRHVRDFGLNPGAYYRLSKRYEFLVEYDFVRALGDGRSPEETTHGLALGFNAVLTEAFELITQIQREFARGDEGASLGVAVGFIATLPLSR